MRRRGTRTFKHAPHRKRFSNRCRKMVSSIFFLISYIIPIIPLYIYIYLNKCVLMYFGRFGSKSIILSCNQDRYGTIKTDCSSTSQLHGHQAWHHRKSAPHSPPWQSKATYETGKAGSVTHRIIPSNSKWLHVIPSYSMLFSQWNMDKRGTSCVTSDPSP